MAMKSEELPEEIIQQIQKRLPVKSLMRFTSVSKWWSSIIADPKFAKSHYLLASQQQSLSRRLLLWNIVNRQFESLDLDTSSVRKLTFPIDLERGYWGPYTIDLLGSCNGLVFLCASLDEYSFFDDDYGFLDDDYGSGGKSNCFSFYVWNPTTGFVRNLPAPSFPCDQSDIRNCGFGYVTATDDYKVAFSAYDCIERKHIFEIFSWRANSWKRIEKPFYKDRFENLGENEYNGGFSSQGTVLNEALHWIEIFGAEPSREEVVFDEPSREEVVLVFDLVNDVFRKLQLPIRNIDFSSWTTLGVVFGGCLSVAFCEANGYGAGDDCMELWVMREYNVPESWTKLYIRNQSSPFYRRKPLFCWENCIFTLEVTEQLNQLIRFDFEEEKTDNYNLSSIIEGEWPMNNPFVIGYDESLLRPHDYQA